MLEQLDLDMFNEMAESVSSRWGHVEELLVAVCTRLDTLLRVTIKVNSKQQPQLGPPFEYPRPGRSSEPAVKPAAVHPADVARRMLMGGG